MINNIINDSNKILIKIGSSTITSADGSIDKDFLENLAPQIKTLMEKGKKIVLVSSGARIAGVSTIGKWSRKEDVNYKHHIIVHYKQFDTCTLFQEWALNKI